MRGLHASMTRPFDSNSFGNKSSFCSSGFCRNQLATMASVSAPAFPISRFCSSLRIFSIRGASPGAVRSSTFFDSLSTPSRQRHDESTFDVVIDVRRCTGGQECTSKYSIHVRTYLINLLAYSNSLHHKPKKK